MSDRFKEICDYLVELKNTSELMIGLAYSSVLLNSRELAEEVQMLEEHMDRLHTDFELLVISSSGGEDARDMLGLIRLGLATEMIADAAAEIAEVVLRGEETHPVLRMVIEEAEETVERATLSENSPLVGKTLREARIPEETGMWVLAIRRRGRWIRPRPDTVLEAGDVLIASGYADGVEDFRRLVEGSQNP
ncbi:hypothetical protein DRO24_00485 [Candidatus Bathyarchaeota archaeon]|nr:MAG: hypothetical protein DRO24_00485 [Candidatus Bathyarchaeota archaeon]